MRQDKLNRDCQAVRETKGREREREREGEKKKEKETDRRINLHVREGIRSDIVGVEVR